MVAQLLNSHPNVPKLDCLTRHASQSFNHTLHAPIHLFSVQKINLSSVISTFSWGGQNLFLFFNATGQLKIWKKQHFICCNLTLFIVPFFLSFFFFIFSSFFLFFFFFFLFFFFLFPWGGGDGPPSPPQMTPLINLLRDGIHLFFRFTGGYIMYIVQLL